MHLAMLYDFEILPPLCGAKHSGGIFHSFILAALLAPLFGCTTQLTPQARTVNLVTASSINACYLVDSFTLHGSSADDATNLAFNHAAAIGADSMGIKNIDQDGTVTALAFVCKT